MKARIVVIVGALLLLSAAPARAGLVTRWFGRASEVDRLNAQIKGRVLDFTFNHGVDRRIWSAALCCKRDLYVYLPPGYDPSQTYPIMFFMHGFGMDEHCFLELIDLFDGPMARGCAPPMIIVAPDGSISGRPTLLNGGSFYVNTKAGRFEDYVMRDVWDFAHRSFPIRPEREAHVMCGGSMGGFGAYNLAIKHRDRIGVVCAIFPPLNVRYLDCHGRYFSDFDPNCLGWRTQLQPFAPVARYAGGLITIRQRRVLRPLYGRDPNAIDEIARNNPVEMLDTYDVKPGELEMFVAYVGHDAFNIDAQVESFLYIARGKGLTVSSVYMADGRHNMTSAKKLTPALMAWLAPRLAPFAPAAAR